MSKWKLITTKQYKVIKNIKLKLRDISLNIMEELQRENDWY